MLKNHVRSEKCDQIKAKREREEKEKKWKKKDGSILTFMKAKVPLNPSTVKDPLPVKATQMAARGLDKGSPVSLMRAEPVNVIRRLRMLTANLPDHIPEATEDDSLAILSRNPVEYDDPSIDSKDLWEEVLNPLLKSVLGWGREMDTQDLIQRGEKGMDAVLRFTEYFISARGVDPSLFEGKLKIVSLFWISFDTDSPGAIESARKTNIVDVDPEISLTVRPNTQHIRCKGFRLDFPDGMSPYGAYPSELHTRYVLPWDYTIQRGVMTLYAQTCSDADRGLVEREFTSCKACRQLKRNDILMGIMERLQDGVHESLSWEFHGLAGLRELLRRKNAQTEFYRLRGLNQARTLLGKATALSDHKRLVSAVAMGLSQNRGIRGLLSMVEAAAQDLYHPKSWTETEEMRALLLLKMGGSRVAQVNQRSSGAPSLTYLRQRSFTPPIVPSPSHPTASEVSQNVKAVFQNVIEIVQERVKAQHVVVMFDELATEKRIRYDEGTNFFLGVCREHGDQVSLEFNGESDLEELFKALDEKQIHYAAEATIAALGVLCNDHRIYPARPVLVSGDCKQESGEEHAKVIQTVVKGINSERPNTRFRIVSLASDGESRRGYALGLLTFKHQLSNDSPIYPLLFCLILMDLHVGHDDLTCDKDYKHIFKRWRNLFLRPRGVVVCGVRITPAIIKRHLREEGASAEHIRSLFNPSDQQDVKAAFDLLKGIWSLPKTTSNPRLGFQAARKSLWILGKLLYHLVFPYLCADLSLSEQLEHLSAAAHLAFVLYQPSGKAFIPTELYIDVMLMIKNAYFCVAKAKVDDPDGSFWITLLGTDRLEELFGILRTMVGNDANLDILQLVSRITSTTEVSNIFAKYPEWDRAPRHSADHIKPRSWRGNVGVREVTLQTAWRRGRTLVETECEFSGDILSSAELDPTIHILAPSGILLVTAPLADDDIDESLDDIILAARNITPSSEAVTSEDQLEPELEDNDNDTEPTSDDPIPAIQSPISAPTDDVDDQQGANSDRVDIENCLSDMAFEDGHAQSNNEGSQPQQSRPSRTLKINGRDIVKSKFLSQFSQYRKRPGSFDRLKRVQDVDRYTSGYLNQGSLHLKAPHITPNDPVLLISDPVASLLSADKNAWLVIGEVNGITIDGEPVEYVPHKMLRESIVSVSYQVIGLRPASSAEDPSSEHDWRSFRPLTEKTFSVAGCVIQPINPSTSTDNEFYLFDSRVLVALASSLFEGLVQAELKNLPKTNPDLEFPYRERAGKACFICNDNGGFAKISDANTFDCPLCLPERSVTLDLSQGQRVLEHIGSHILYDPVVDRSLEPCGLCLQPSSVCKYIVKKGKGAHGSLKVDRSHSTGCLAASNFSYSVASKSKSSSPCSNVPIPCPLCPRAAPAIWRYNLEHHLKVRHPSAGDQHKHLYQLTTLEIEKLKALWTAPKKGPKKHTTKKATPALVISAAHEAAIRPPCVFIALDPSN
ncbi:hypothetical protein BDN72DRAFT_870211 [Pluteus cervinus]|uniref:Uncharacterized protein n=1 Tax=Pluteus cervinus TaxID=181527 RepID=A0ACD3AZA1_9AGAR|nr:hypothetical protein BDN72DRAFT_870211 [Pluteus cervinus]